MITTLTDEYRKYLPAPLRPLPWRAHPLDGKLLLFDRQTGLNILLEGDEVAEQKRIAPRNLLIAVTNACNLSCPFCYRDLKSPSQWHYDSLMAFCRGADRWGVLEVAFGGGEPMLFPRWQEFIIDLHETSGLCINFTTNGTLLTAEFLKAIEGRYGQIRLSIYEDNHPEETLRLLGDCGARYGVNWLISPAEMAGLESKFEGLVGQGVRDFLFLSYKGNDPALHLRPDEMARFSEFLNGVYRTHGSSISLKLDSCWGNALPDVPRLFHEDDCGAGDDILSITSDKLIKPCSFHATWTGIRFETIDDVRAYWERRRLARSVALIGGCARLPNRGINQNGMVSDEIIDLAAVQQQS
jgi:MoaA/NifB/PqqE/SkfB family radical SAM enzyme